MIVYVTEGLTAVGTNVAVSSNSPSLFIDTDFEESVTFVTEDATDGEDVPENVNPGLTIPDKLTVLLWDVSFVPIIFSW